MVVSAAFMETPNVPGAAAPTSAPSAPSTTATPTPAPAPAATPAAPAAAPAATPSAPVEDDRSVYEILRDKMITANSAQTENAGGEAGEDLPGTGEAAPVAEPAVDPSEQATETAAEPVAQTEQVTGQDLTDVDPSGFGADALSAVLGEDAALTAALEANPEAKAAVFANARKAARAVEYDQIAGSPDDARAAVQSHESLSNISNLLADVDLNNAQSVSSVIDAMVAQTVLRDEAGNPLLNQDGIPRTDGSIGRFFKGFFKGRMEFYAEQFKQSGDDDGLAAIDFLMERTGLRPTSRPGSEEEMSEAMRARAAELDAREHALNERNQTQQQKDLTALDTRVNGQTDATLKKTLDGILDKATGMTPYERGAAERAISKGLQKAIKESATYKADRRRIESLPVGPKREAELVRLNSSYIARHLPGIAKNVMAEAGLSIESKAAARGKTQAAREAASRSENRGSLSTTPSAPAPAKMTIEEAEAQLTQTLNRKPEMWEILAHRVKSANAAAAR